MIDFVARLVGKLVLYIILLTAILVGLVLSYTELSLPKGIDDREFESWEGFAQRSLSASLIETNNEERQGRRVAVLSENAGYIHSVIDRNGDRIGEPIFISRYFKTDFASIPFPFNRIINPFGRHAEAAILHDYLYALGDQVPNYLWLDSYYDQDEIIDAFDGRKYADTVFYEAMRHSGVNWFRRRIMYAAVRLGGGKAFGRENEWYENFYDPELQIDIPRECIPDRSDLSNLWKSWQPIYFFGQDPLFPEEVYYLRKDMTLAEYNQSILEHVRDYLHSMRNWEISFENDTCLDFFVSSLLAKVNSQGIDPTPRNILARLHEIESSRHFTVKSALKHMDLLERYDPDNQRKNVSEEVKLNEFNADCAVDDFRACFEVGEAYRFGRGTDVDLEAALQSYRKSCDGGYALGCYSVGTFYFQGLNGEKDVDLGIDYLRKEISLNEAACDLLPTKKLKYFAFYGWDIVTGEQAGTECMDAAERRWQLAVYLFDSADSPDQARAALNELAKTCEMYNASACNGLAWILSTSNEDYLLNGDAAVKFALVSMNMDPESAEFSDTLAAAYARNGQFEKAVETQEKAILLLSEESGERAGFEARLVLYRNGQAYTEPQ